MAGYNPFRAFRKNRKFWLAILGVGTMISFIILPAVLQLFTGGGGAKPGEIARCRRFGDVNQFTVGNLRQNRNVLYGFYDTLYRTLIMSSPDQDQESRMALFPLERVLMTYQQQTDTESLINNWLLARYAADQGISIPKTMIVDHLSQLTSGRLSDKVFQDTLRAVGLNERQLESLMTEELLTSQMFKLFEISQSTVTPATRWNWFQRLNRRMTTEVGVVLVDRFVSQVADPGDAALRKFFEDNKNRLYDPTQKETGFTVPNRIAFQYVRAVPSRQLLDSFSDEEVKAYYEAHKEPEFRKPVRPLGERPSLPGLDPMGPGGAGNIFRPGLGGFTPGSSRTRPENVIPRTDEKSADEAPAPATGDAAPSESKPDAAKAKEPKAETEAKPAEAEPAGDGPKTSLRRRDAVTRLVSYQAEKAADVSGTDSPEAAAGKTEPETKADNAKPEEAKAGEPKPEAQSDEGKLSAGEKTESTTSAEAVDLSILYKPLSEVEEEIREILAREKIEKALAAVEGKMRDHFQAYNLYQDQDPEKLGAAAKAPVMPDLTAFAAEQGLELVTVSMGDFFQAMNSDFARGTRERNHMATRLFGEIPILFDPHIIDGDSGQVLIWVTESIPQHTPERFEDVRDTVLARWKEVEARPLAEKRARELAETATASEKSLAETFASQDDMHVVETEPFTWKTYGQGLYAGFMAMQGIPPRLDEVREKGVRVGEADVENRRIFAPGEEFMEAVSELSVGETAVVFNQPHNAVYIVRLISSSPSEESLWEDFQAANFMEYRLAGQPEELRDGLKDWLERIHAEVGFQWIQRPSLLERGF